MPSIYKIVFLTMSAGMLTACSSCHILSSNNSAACKALYVGGAIVAAPVLVPKAIIENNFSGILSQQDSARLQKEIEQGKPSSTFYCLANQCEQWQKARDSVLATDTFASIMRFYAHVGTIDQQYRKPPVERDLELIGLHLYEAEQLLESGVSAKDIKEEWMMYRRDMREENANFDRFLNRLSVYRVVADLQQKPASKVQKILQNCVTLPTPKYHYLDFTKHSSSKPAFCEKVYLAYHGASYKKGNSFFSFDKDLPEDIEERWYEQNKDKE